ncbi:MAG: D-alanyl-D-alanine carboxypeptidase family protein [Proteobacteria bacterium]|nr:D-alanyl-D-alanine carboxypeptidase family protein [Pseudomonadota bacterium]
MKKIDPAHLTPMDMFEDTGWLRVHLAYARPDCFCGTVYREGARLWLHGDLAAVTVLAAKRLHEKNGFRMIVYDGLRTVEAQDAMLQSPAVRANPHWLAAESRVLSPPGMGGHPRGMAVDISLEDANGNLLDMGTAFDEFPSGGNGPDENRAHRDYAGLPGAVKESRRILQDAMTGAADALDLLLLPLPVEWWDFRFPADTVRAYAPLSDRDLPPQMRMTDRYADESGMPDFPPGHFEQMKKEILARIQDL